MKSGGNSVHNGAVRPIGKLEGVERGRESGDDVFLYQALKAFHHDGSESGGPVIVL